MPRGSDVGQRVCILARRISVRGCAFSASVVISYHDDMMKGTVGTRSPQGMITLFVARLHPQCVPSPLKRLPALHVRRRNLHAGGVDYNSEVESIPLLRIVRNRASESSNLRSEVSYNQRVDPDPHSMRSSQLSGDMSSRNDITRAQRLKELEPLVEAWEEWIRVWKVGQAAY